MKKYFFNTILTNQFQKYLLSTFIIQKIQFLWSKYKKFNEEKSFHNEAWLYFESTILYLCLKLFHFKYTFNFWTFLVYFTMFSPSSKSKQHMS
jgi:hypothetical protein